MLGYDPDDHDNAKGFQDTKCTIKPCLLLVIVFTCVKTPWKLCKTFPSPQLPQPALGLIIYPITLQSMSYLYINPVNLRLWGTKNARYGPNIG